MKAGENNIDALRQSRPVDSRLLALLRKLPQLTRMNRHLWSVLKHSTPRKLWNLLLVETELRLRKTKLRGRPYILIVDPLNVCNLRCPLCPTGVGELERKQQKMDWEVYTRIIDQLAPWGYEVNLHNWGESLLHPRIFDMIRYAVDRNLATNMSTNFNRVNDEKIDRLIESGLEYLILSIDGVSQDVYAKYRVRGNIDRVLANVRKLVARKKALGSSTPFIEWQFILFGHNAHELEAARKLAGEIGVNRFRVIPPGIPFHAREPEKLKEKWLYKDDSGKVQAFTGGEPGACFYLYRSITTNPDGGSAPCCIVYGDRNDFGDLGREPFEAIWNNEKYRSARSLFRKGGKGIQPTVCDGCHIFQHRGQPAENVVSGIQLERRA